MPSANSDMSWVLGSPVGSGILEIFVEWAGFGGEERNDFVKFGRHEIGNRVRTELLGRCEEVDENLLHNSSSFLPLT